MKKSLQVIVRHGYLLMAIGMALALAGIFFLVDPRRRVGPLRQTATAVAIAGFVIYFVGRICVVLDRRTPRRPSDTNNHD